MKLLILSVVLLSFNFSCLEKSMPVSPVQKEWAIAIHGGAGYLPKDIAPESKKMYLESLEEALSIGKEILENGGSALDAVEKTINYLENNEHYNAGRGAVLTNEGINELDAAIMDGTNKTAGAITGVRTVKNPISLARKVMEESDHILFAGEGAERFADLTTVERVEPEYFQTEAMKGELMRVKGQTGFNSIHEMEDNGWKMGTVGCVALDRDGNLVAGTSTGGMTNKKFGRVGDVPIIGSGTYANELVAVSGTGWGERIMLNVSAHSLASYMEFKEATLQESMDYLIDDLLNRREAGFIAVDKYGNFAMKTNTTSMLRAAQDSEGNKVVDIWDD